MSRVVIIDDEESLCQALAGVMRQEGHEVFCAQTIASGVMLAEQVLPDVIFLDVMFPEGNGLEAIPPLRRIASAPEIILLTGRGDVESAEIATRRGAWSYILKGPSVAPILNALSNALDYRNEKREPGAHVSWKTDGIWGSSPEVQHCLRLAEQAAASDATVMVFGETGTGKDLLARAIHNNSRRRQKRFVVVDCAALPDNLVESILFGHVRGAFTGADQAHEGLVQQADGGTLFLDEIGELPLSLQKPFLRVLQERRFRPVGGSQEISSDFRLVAATNRDLEQMVREGRFRQDLLYRIKMFEIMLPPLRKRPGDAAEIIAGHMAVACQRYNIPPKQVSQDFLEVVEQYNWPGNIRELIQAVERAIVVGHYHDTLFARHLPEDIQVAVARSKTERSLSEGGMAAVAEEQSQYAPPQPPQPLLWNQEPSPVPFPSFKDARELAANAAEQEYLIQLMDYTKGDIQEACAVSGLSRSRLYALLKQHAVMRRN